MFNESDWVNISEIIPTKDDQRCQKRWNWIQKRGVKTTWTQKEDEILRVIVEKIGPKEWHKIAEMFNQENGDNSNRNGKQCRNRWMNSIDPQIKKGQWTPEEDLVLLERQ